MKKLYLIVLITFIQCSKKENEVIVCTPVPSYKDINIVDKLTDENVFSSGRFARNQLQIITNPANIFPVSFRNDNSFTLYPIDKVGVINFSIVLNNEIIILLSTTVFFSDEGICGKYYRFQNFTSSDPNIILIENIDSIKIKI